jgi:hypothetical protein
MKNGASFLLHRRRQSYAAPLFLIIFLWTQKIPILMALISSQYCFASWE